MKKITLILLTITFFAACNKDESVLNDYDLFGRLQQGNGTWQFESLTKKDNSIPNSTEIPQQGSFDFIHFYIKTSFVSNVTIETNHSTFYSNNNLQQSRDCQAEKQRIVFDDGNIFGGEVWTVIENKPNKQVWKRIVGSNTSTLTLKRCDCKIPTTALRESKG